MHQSWPSTRTRETREMATITMASHFYQLQENAFWRSSSDTWCPTSLTTSFQKASAVFDQVIVQWTWSSHSDSSKRNVEQQRSLYITFMDLTKTFDTVGRYELWKLLPNFGCPPCLTNIIHQFYEGIEGHINICGELSDQFSITNSVKQGCVLAPTVF